jgi:hypothetical protein
MLFESMLDSVLFARDKWLAPGGLMCPSHADIFLSALDDQAFYDSRFNFWDNIYGNQTHLHVRFVLKGMILGLKMTCIKEKRFREAVVSVVDSECIISDYVPLKVRMSILLLYKTLLAHSI